ncbi:AI-2E family transporter [Thermithiobacillus tepidarius DSM 3134]|uniref:AI-2E family transporter n=1 Tax=Thermithiobacillus tepidarius TaxID=929 RepID=UPI0004118DCD|nr:AI-2E family transporter [Thermithiobacillus tepidarius]
MDKRVKPEADWDERLFRVLVRIILLAAAVYVLLQFLAAITYVLLFFAFVLVFSVALNPPVVWLERRGVPRVAGALLVALAGLLLAALLGWLVVPDLITQVTGLVENLPQYAAALAQRLSRLMADYPDVQQRLQAQFDAYAAERLIPSVQTLLIKVGQYSLSFFNALVFGILLFSTVVYALINPRPLLQGYLLMMPDRWRDAAARAFSRGAKIVNGWIWSNIIVGGIEGVAAAIFLAIMEVPGAVLWGVLAFFAEMVPRLGPYLAALPPILVALAVDPMTALWVAIFYVVLQEISGDFIAPQIRSSQMNIHPVTQLFVLLAMTAVFGLVGALIALPITGFLTAYYEEFYVYRQSADARLQARIDAMLSGRIEDDAQAREQPPDRG